MSNVQTVVVRFHMEREEDRRAYMFLQTIGKKEYGSYSRAIIAAIDGFYSRREKAERDPYLETREKEDHFLAEIRSAVEHGIQSATQEILTADSSLQVQLISDNSSASEEEDYNAAMDFINAFCR